MRKNHFIVLAALLSALLLLSACGGGSEPSSQGGDSGEKQPAGGDTATADAAPAEDVTLSVLVHFDPLILGEEVIDGLQIAADNLGYTVNIERIDPETYKTKIRVALQGNELPDVFYLWGGSYKDPFLEANAILPLDDAVEQYGSAIFPSVIPPRDGHIYNAPNDALGVYGMFYNKEVLDDLGVGPPKDWDELLNVVELCNAKGIYAIGIGNNDRWQGDLFYNAMVMSEDADAFRNAASGAGSFTDEPFLEAARKVDTLVSMGAFQRGYMTASQNDVVEMFAAGQIALHPIGAWMLPTFAGEGFGDISGYTYFPKMGKEDPVLAVNDAGSDLGLAVAANSKFPEEAKHYVMEYSIVVNDLKVANGLAPFAETSVQPPADQHQILKDYATMLSKFSKLQTYWFDVVDAKSGEPMRDLSHKQFAGEISPEDFVNELEEIMRL